MGADSKIEWCHHTFNPWTGCARVSPGCEHCYAETLSKRAPQTFGQWGHSTERRVTSDANWRKPLAWNRAAAKAGERHRVFCGSMCDIFEEWPGSLEVRGRLFGLIQETSHLDWLLLTKRADVAYEWFMNMAEAGPWPNVWLGVSVEDQRRADERIPYLIDAPGLAVRFLSCEPLLAPVDLTRIPLLESRPEQPWWPHADLNALTGHVEGPDDILPHAVDWVIVGGESGPGARPMDLRWARSIVGQCRDADVPVFVKQLGSNPRWDGALDDLFGVMDRKGGDMSEWPDDLRIREFPTPSTAAVS